MVHSLHGTEADQLACPECVEQRAIDWQTHLEFIEAGREFEMSEDTTTPEEHGEKTAVSVAPVMTPEQRASLAKAAGQPAVTGPAPTGPTVGEYTDDQKKALGKAAMIIAARTAHEANRAYCLHLGDDSQKPWGEASDSQRSSALGGVQQIVASPGLTPAQSHSMWMAYKGAEGWVYGEEKDEEAKTHPCMVPFAELPASQQFKDSLFGAVVRGVLGVK